MYQIGTRETRVLVDVPGKLPSSSNGDLKKYMEQVVAPELPESIRVSLSHWVFATAINVNQTYICSPSFWKLWKQNGYDLCPIAFCHLQQISQMA